MREGVQSSVPPDIPGYPSGDSSGGQPGGGTGGESGGSTPDSTTPTYYPSDGVTPDTTWNEFTEEPSYVPPGPGERPQNPYNPPSSDNPEYQSGTPEWKNETSENMLPLMNIRFDKLFPFSMLYDIPKVANKVRSVTGTQINNGVYNRVSIPIWNPVNSSDMLNLELSDLYSLLVMVRPFMQILLAAFLLFTAIAFWRNILTG